MAIQCKHNKYHTAKSKNLSVSYLWSHTLRTSYTNSHIHGIDHRRDWHWRRPSIVLTTLRSSYQALVWSVPIIHLTVLSSRTNHLDMLDGCYGRLAISRWICTIKEEWSTTAILTGVRKLIWEETSYTIYIRQFGYCSSIAWLRRRQDRFANNKGYIKPGENLARKHIWGCLRLLALNQACEGL